MHANEAHVGSLTCMRQEIGTPFTRARSKELGTNGQQPGLATTMLSDVQYWGACAHVILVLSISQLIATEPKECHFSAVFRPEN